MVEILGLELLSVQERSRPTKRVETDPAYGRAAHPQQRWAPDRQTR
jgi:hypothetical protein